MKTLLLIALTTTAAGIICHGFTVTAPPSTRRVTSLSADGSDGEFALLFDCDGVISKSLRFFGSIYHAAPALLIMQSRLKSCIDWRTMLHSRSSI